MSMPNRTRGMNWKRGQVGCGSTRLHNLSQPVTVDTMRGVASIMRLQEKLACLDTWVFSGP